jgi:hypothetical protein
VWGGRASSVRTGWRASPARYADPSDQIDNEHENENEHDSDCSKARVKRMGWEGEAPSEPGGVPRPRATADPFSGPAVPVLGIPSIFLA